MKLLIQRVTQANISVAGEEVAQIDQGLLVLVGFCNDDKPDVLKKAVSKLVNLRIFSDEHKHFQFSALDHTQSILAVPQFTLYANTNSGRRPDFIRSMKPKQAAEMFAAFCRLLSKESLKKVDFGVFGADMKVSLVNDGPVTIMLEF